MSRKLSDTEKQAIVDLYRQPETSTSVLAERFEVSASTVGRILKNGIPADEYHRLVQQKKRLGRGSLRHETPASEQLGLPTSEPAVAAPAGAEPSDEGPSGSRRRRRRSASRASEPAAETNPTDEVAAADTASADNEPAAPAKPARPVLAQNRRDPVETDPVETDASDRDADFAGSADLGTDSDADSDADNGAASSTDDGADDSFELPEIFGDYDSDDADDSDEEWDDADSDTVRQTALTGDVRVLPFAQADFPKTCYLAIDKVSEPIVKPLSDFNELGAIPDAEAKQPTLAIFDNHRVARRFAASRFQRVLKIPDSGVLHKARPYLAAKGITRLLLDGRVYSLTPEDD